MRGKLGKSGTHFSLFEKKKLKHYFSVFAPIDKSTFIALGPSNTQRAKAEGQKWGRTV